MAKDPRGAAPNVDPDDVVDPRKELIEIEHPDVDGTAFRTSKQLDRLKAKGWRAVQPTRTREAPAMSEGGAG